MRRCLTQVAIASAAFSLSLPAFAQSAERKQGCPPGSWFCVEADVSVAPPPQAQPPQRQQPQAQPPQEAPPVIVDEPAPAEPAPQVVHRRRRQVIVYQDVPAPPPQVIIVTPGYSGGYGYNRPAPRPLPRPAARKYKWHPEFGLNLRVAGLAMGHTNGRADSAGMGGVGLSLRYRPVPAFAFDLGADIMAGNDYNGFQRVEVPLSLNGLIYVNPRSRAQFYLIGGAHLSRASVRSDIPAPQLSLTRDGDYGTKYTYFGGQGGAGLEVRASRHVAINLDVLGFVRKRIDDGRAPEFIDYDTGKTTNTSGGALIRGGLTFWF